MRSKYFFSSRIVQVVSFLFVLSFLIGGELLRVTESAGVNNTESVKTLTEGAGPSQSGSPEVIGQWSSPAVSTEIIAIHMHLLPNGKVLLWQDDNNSGYPPTRIGTQTLARVWDVNTGVITTVDLTGKNLFCSGHAFLPDGRLFIAGGHDTGDGDGIREAHIFDSTNNSWTQMSQLMEMGRWYPSALTVGNGEIVVVSGNDSGSNNATPDVWKTNAGGGWRRLTTATLGLQTYPYLHLAPNGKVFFTGPEGTSRYLDTADSGAWSFVAERVGGERISGGSVMYEPGKVVMMGGREGTNVKNTAEIIDLNGAATWTATGVGSMANARIQMNATILPDGKVLVTGGSNSLDEAAGAILQAEMWNPATKNFTPMASMAKKRLYHSTAILLPDARVLSAGGGRPPGPQFPDLHNSNAEIYSPPYLFTTGGGAATRPTIDSHLSKAVRPGDQIFVTTPEASSISDVTLIALSSVTHTANMSQRFNRLTFTQGMGGLNVTMPANSNLCPPGYYMLFVLNSNGVPSVARIINVNSANAAPPGAPSNLVATATSTSSVSLSWSAGSGSIDHYEIQRATSKNGPFTTLPNTSSTSATDSSLSSTTTYIYRVRAVDAQGNYSAFSNTDIATTIVFTDDPLTAGVTIVKAVHVSELRAAVNAVRAAAGLSAATWTDSSLAGIEVKAVHISELRSNVDAARTVLGLSNSAYTDSTLTATVTVIKAVHASELRDRVK